MRGRRLKLIAVAIASALAVGTTVALGAIETAQSCVGQQVVAGSNLSTVVAAAPAGTTFCLSAGVFNVGSQVMMKDGDALVGAGQTQTFLRGTIANLIGAASGASWAVSALDISGAQGDAACAPNCGRAMEARGTKLTVIGVVCHDNENQCIGGGGAEVSFTDSECFANGGTPTAPSEFVGFTATRSTSCIKRASTDGGKLTITGSNIHDNAWIGVWCDFCHIGPTTITGNTIVGNGKAGVAYEVSGGWSATDSALISNNVIQGNGLAPYANAHAAITCNSCAELSITGNTFGGNGDQGAVYFQDAKRGPWGPLYGISVADNVLNGDMLICPAGVTCSGNVESAPSPSPSPTPQEQIAALEAEVASLQISLAAAQTQVASLTASLAASQAELAASQTRVATLEARLAAAEAIIDAVRAALG